MPTNRFFRYNPQQYQSQFVPTKLPVEQMSKGLQEKQKAFDSAKSVAAKTSDLFDIEAPRHIEEFRMRKQNLQEEYNQEVENIIEDLNKTGDARKAADSIMNLRRKFADDPDIAKIKRAKSVEDEIIEDYRKAKAKGIQPLFGNRLQQWQQMQRGSEDLVVPDYTGLEKQLDWTKRANQLMGDIREDENITEHLGQLKQSGQIKKYGSIVDALKKSKGVGSNKLMNVAASKTSDFLDNTPEGKQFQKYYRSLGMNDEEIQKEAKEMLLSSASEQLGYDRSTTFDRTSKWINEAAKNSESRMSKILSAINKGDEDAIKKLRGTDEEGGVLDFFGGQAVDVSKMFFGESREKFHKKIIDLAKNKGRDAAMSALNTLEESYSNELEEKGKAVSAVGENIPGVGGIVGDIMGGIGKLMNAPLNREIDAMREKINAATQPEHEGLKQFSKEYGLEGASTEKVMNTLNRVYKPNKQQEISLFTNDKSEEMTEQYFGKAAADNKEEGVNLASPGFNMTWIDDEGRRGVPTESPNKFFNPNNVTSVRMLGPASTANLYQAGSNPEQKIKRGEMLSQGLMAVQVKTKEGQTKQYWVEGPETRKADTELQTRLQLPVNKPTGRVVDNETGKEIPVIPSSMASAMTGGELENVEIYSRYLRSKGEYELVAKKVDPETGEREVLAKDTGSSVSETSQKLLNAISK